MTSYRSRLLLTCSFTFFLILFGLKTFTLLIVGLCRILTWLLLLGSDHDFWHKVHNGAGRLLGVVLGKEVADIICGTSLLPCHKSKNSTKRESKHYLKVVYKIAGEQNLKQKPIVLGVLGRSGSTPGRQKKSQYFRSITRTVLLKGR